MTSATNIVPVNKQTFDLSALSDPSGHIDLKETVGSGTYGDVYKAEDLHSGRVIAVKTIKLEPNDNFAVIQQEILMMKNCQHPNIVGFYGSYLRRNRLWICMEYCGGGSLQDIYNVTGPLSEPQISLVCRETLKGLSYLHSLGMMHRDIKAGNILLTTNGDVKLADFGVSAQITATMRKRKSFIGSPYWMAPEVAAVEREGGYNQKCDIWSVGITAIELYELQPPMFDLHPMKALHIMSRPNFKPPNLKDKHRCSEDYQNFVKSSLKVNPKKRPPADKLLEHPFVSLEIPKQLMRDLLAKSNSLEFSHFNEESDIDEDRIFNNLPTKIPSKILEGNHPLFSHPLEKSRESTSRKPSNSEHYDNNVQTTLTNDQSGTITAAIISNADSDSRQQSIDEDPADKPPEVPPRRKDRKRPVSIGVPISYRNSAEFASIIHDKPQRVSIQELPRTPGKFNLPPPPSLPPPPPPIRSQQSSSSSKQQVSYDGKSTLANGLPPTPKVYMGACFSKVFNGCPLAINCTVSWVHPQTRDQHIILGCDEGIYTLNLNELHDACMDHIFPRRTTWMFVIKDVLYTISGKTVTYLYRHDLVNLHNSCKPTTNRFGSQIDSMINKIPEKFVPRKFTASTKVSDTKGCVACCVGKKPFNGYKYLCGAVENGTFLMQWYNPLNKFVLLKQYQLYIPPHLPVFEMIITPDQEYPLLCVGVRVTSGCASLKLDLINLNSTTNLYGDEDLSGTIIPVQDQLDIALMSQIERDKIVVCYDQTVHFVTLNGTTISKMKFNFKIDSIVSLPDCILAFHEHGLQGRTWSFKEVVQEINDSSRVYRLLGKDKIVVLESANDLYILTGHEDTLDSH